MAMNVSSAVAAGLAKAGIKPAGGVRVVIQSKSSGGGGGGGSSSSNNAAAERAELERQLGLDKPVSERIATAVSSGGYVDNRTEPEIKAQLQKEQVSDVAKGLLLAGLEAKKKPAEAINFLNANIAGTINNQKIPNNFNKYTQQNPLVSTVLKDIEKKNTVFILTDENNKPKGIEYGGQSLTLKGFENAYGAKLLYDDNKEEYFFGTSATPEKKLVSSISGDIVPITKEQKKEVSKFLLDAKIKEVKLGAVKGGVLGIADVLTDKKVSTYLKKEGTWAFDSITSATTAKLEKYAQLAKEQATLVLNESDLKTGNKKIDLTAKALGYVSYFGGSAGAYALNMVSGLGNLALGLVLKPTVTSKSIIMAAPAMIKNSAYEIHRTIYGRGTIEDFFGSALTLATVAQTAASFSRYGASLKNIKMNRQLKKDLPQIKMAVRQSQTLLKKEQLYTQRIFAKNSNQWKTFGKAYQATNNMNAKHSWYSLSNKRASVIIQKSVIKNKNVRMTNIMVAQSTTDKLFGFLKKIRSGSNELSIIERYPNTNKLAAYLSKVKARRAYTFIQVKGSKVVTAIDGKGSVSVLRSSAEVQSFIRNAKFGKFSFTGSKVVGGNIETILRAGKNTYIGSEAFTRLAQKKTAGISVVRKAAKGSDEITRIKYSGGKKTPFSKTFGKQELAQVSKQVQLPKNIALSKGVSTSVVSSQLKNVAKSISKTIAKNDLALKTGFRAVVGSTGLMFFSKTGRLVSAREATNVSNKRIEIVSSGIRSILKDNTKQIPRERYAQKSAEASAQNFMQEQASAQKEIQRVGTGARGGRTNFKFKLKPFKPRFPLPNLDSRKNSNIVKKILGNKLAPSYRILVGSGKKVRALGGRYSPKDAISKGAFTIDRSKERTIRIIPTKQKPNSSFKMNYLRQADRKFRNYRIKQGKRVRYSSTRLIEKRKYFNDLERLTKFRKGRIK